MITSLSPYYGKKYDRMLSMASQYSHFSPMQQKHGAIIFQGKRLICGGYNNNQRNAYMGNFSCSIHAEVDVLVKFLNSFAKIHIIKGNPDKIRRKLKKYSLCVVRTHNIDNQCIYQNSSPCKDCVGRLQMVGLNKVTYSISNTENQTDKICKINPVNHDHSKSQRSPNVQQYIKSKSFLV